MTRQEISDLKLLAQKIEYYCNQATAHKLMSESRERRTNALMRKYPNMKPETARETIWREMNEQVNAVNFAYDEMRSWLKTCEETINVIGWNSASPESAFIHETEDGD